MPLFRTLPRLPGTSYGCAPSGAVSVIALAAVLGCSSSEGGDGDGSGKSDGTGGSISFAGSGNAAGSGASPGGDAGGASGSAGSGASSGGGGRSGSVFDGSECIGETRQAETVPLDLFVLFDQSGSMSNAEGSGDRLDAVRAAMTDFIRSPESGGMGIGIRYFGHMEIGETSCDPSDYTDPAVPIAALPDAEAAMLESLNSIIPVGETPTGAAIRGACDYIAARRESTPGRELAVLILTDGVPEAPVSMMTNGCSPTLPDAIVATEECVERTGAPIYVIGVGPNLGNLNQIAEAGGSSGAFLVDGGDVTEKVLDALNTVRGALLPCEVFIPEAPPGETLDLGKVNVIARDRSGFGEDVVNVESGDQCDANTGGWFYDPPEAPERIRLCEQTCEFLQSQSDGGALEIALGCATLGPR